MAGVAATYDSSSHLRNYLYKGKKASLMGRGSSPRRGNYLSSALISGNKVELGQHTEAIEMLQTKLKEAQDELRNKENLISRLVDEEDSRDPSPRGSEKVK